MRTTVPKLIELLGQRRGQMLALAASATIVSLLDAAAAVLVFSLFRMLAAPEQGLQLPVLGDVGRFAPGLEPSGLLLAGGFLVAGVFAMRSIAYLAQAYAQNRVANHAAVDIADDLARGYLAMPYALHLHRNSAELVRNAYEGTQRLTNEVLTPAIRIISESLTVVAILGVLLATAPAATGLMLAIFGPTVFILVRVVNPRLEQLGKTAFAMGRTSLQSIQQALSGLRDIKVLERERFFADDFRHQRRRQARARYLRGTALELPRTTIETVLVLAVAAFLAFTVLTGRSPQDAFAVLGLMGYGAFRALPSLNRALQFLNAIRFSTAIVDDIHADLQSIGTHASELSAIPTEPLTLRHAIRLENVHYRYPDTTTDALAGIHLEVRRSMTLGIVGPTGGGKTTLADIIIGLLEPTSGRVTVDGTDIQENLRGWRQNLGVVPQSVFLLDDTLRRNIAFGLPDEKIDDIRLAEAIRLAQLEDFVDRLPDGLDSVVGERGVRISGGQRQRVAIARALYRRPEVLIFDEATSALDSVTEQDFMGALAERLESRTLVMVAHRITTVRDCDRIVVVAGGRIIDSGTYDELFERSDAFRRLATGSR